ncbi:HD domain-containing protein, partial [bacterium]|nr:HD domain-containing protein [bacterium]
MPQEAAWHPEGDVFEHTMQAIDLAARQNYVNDQEKLLIMLAALCHDLGKSVTTKKIDRQWRSFGHAKAGVVLAQKLLGRITSNQNLIKQVSVLVQYHMEPLGFINNNAGLFAYKKL